MRRVEVEKIFNVSLKDIHDSEQLSILKRKTILYNSLNLMVVQGSLCVLYNYFFDDKLFALFISLFFMFLTIYFLLRDINLRSKILNRLLDMNYFLDKKYMDGKITVRDLLPDVDYVSVGFLGLIAQVILFIFYFMFAENIFFILNNLLMIILTYNTFNLVKENTENIFIKE